MPATGASKSKQSAIAKTATELEMGEVQLDFVREALEAFRSQSGYQALQRGVGQAAIGELGGVADPLTSISEEQRAGLVQDYYNQARAGGRRGEEISEIEMDRIRRGGAATPEQIANIRAASDAELQTGLGDISRFASQQREAVGSELAPRLGLHRSDTPILDRGNRIGGEAINAAGRLVSDVRGREAQARLNYPLASAQSNQAQQGMNFSRADVLADLNQRAFQNRLQLTGQVGQQGLGLATGVNAPAAQQSLKPAIATESSSFQFSSRAMKEILSTPDGAKVLEHLLKLPVASWKYLAGDDQEEHIGTFAEDFKAAFGLGDGRRIHLGDMMGVLLAGLQALAERVEELRPEEGA